MNHITLFRALLVTAFATTTPFPWWLWFYGCILEVFWFGEYIEARLEHKMEIIAMGMHLPEINNNKEEK